MAKFEDGIVKLIGRGFRTFGGGRPADGNPIAAALQNTPLAFAAGVDVREVVNFILKEERNRRRRIQVKRSKRRFKINPELPCAT